VLAPLSQTTTSSTTYLASILEGEQDEYQDEHAGQSDQNHRQRDVTEAVDCAVVVALCVSVNRDNDGESVFKKLVFDLETHASVMTGHNAG